MQFLMCGLPLLDMPLFTVLAVMQGIQQRHRKFAEHAHDLRNSWAAMLCRNTGGVHHRHQGVLRLPAGVLPRRGLPLLSGRLFPGNQSPCVICYLVQCQLTPRHFLFGCVDFMAFCQDCFNANTMRDLFTELKHKQIFEFLKLGLYITSCNLGYFLGWFDFGIS